MKQKYALIFSLIWALPAVADQVDYILCHADPIYSEYNYGGVWELDEDGEPICNFWKFLLEGQNERPTVVIGIEDAQESDFYVTPDGNDVEMTEYDDINTEDE